MKLLSIFNGFRSTYFRFINNLQLGNFNEAKSIVENIFSKLLLIERIGMG